MNTNKHKINQDDIYNILEDKIVSLKIMPGETLSENMISSEFHLSRTPIRSVLQRLEQNGFTEIIPQKGSIVTAINLKYVNEYIYMRIAIESMVLRDFIQSATPIQLEELIFHNQVHLENAIEFMKNSTANGIDIEFANKLLALDLDIHECAFRFTDKMYTWHKLTKAHPDYSRFIRLDILAGNNLPDVIREHKQLLDIIENKKYDEIETFLKTHLYGGIRRLRQQIFTKEFAKYIIQE